MTSDSPDGTPVSYHIADGILHLEYHGEITADDIINVRAAFLPDPGFVPGMPCLADLTDASMAHVGPADIRRVAAHWRAMAQGWPPHRTAVVTILDRDFGMARLYGSVAQRPGLELQVFRDRTAALLWLRQAGHIVS